MKSVNTFNDTDLGFAIRDLIESWLRGNVHTSMPGKVESYSATTRTGQVKPLLKIASFDGEQTEIQSIPDVPFVVYGTQNAGVILPVATGDYVLLIFSERSIGETMQSGKVSNTSLTNTHSLGFAIALPGLFPRSSTIPITGSTDITIINNGGKVVIDASGDIELGKGIVQKLANETFVLSHTHSGVTTGSGISGPPVAAVPPISYTTSKVKAL